VEPEGETADLFGGGTFRAPSGLGEFGSETTALEGGGRLGGDETSPAVGDIVSTPPAGEAGGGADLFGGGAFLATEVKKRFGKYN
jgi:hypothetical protein